MDDGQCIIILSATFSCIATIVIAIYAFKSHSLAKSIKEFSTEHQNKIEDLYEAIVISTIVASGRSIDPSEVDKAIDIFKNNYKGKTKIFDQ